MVSKLQYENCLYQEEVVDLLVKSGLEEFLTENPDGNLVLSKVLLAEFRKRTALAVVWVKSEFYWRPRVAEDEDGRDARG
jgi:hypothetical protein